MLGDDGDGGRSERGEVRERGVDERVAGAVAAAFRVDGDEPDRAARGMVVEVAGDVAGRFAVVVGDEDGVRGAAARLADPLNVKLAGAVAREARVGVEAGVGVALGGDALEGRQVLGAKGANVGRGRRGRGRVGERDAGFNQIVSVTASDLARRPIVVGEEIEAADLVGATPLVYASLEVVVESRNADAGNGEAEERGVPKKEFAGVVLLGCG